MKRVPFYANEQDDNHCMVAVYRAVFDYFFRKKFTLQEVEEFVGYEAGKTPWTLVALTKMVEMGFSIRMIEPFDYRAYASQGEPYLHERYTDEQVAWLMEHSNILDIAPYIPAFLAHVNWENRQATLADIDTLLAEQRLVFVTLNGRRLNGLDGYSSHAVLVTDREDDAYVIHDPGLPPRPGRRVLPEALWRAMGSEGNTSEVTGFKLGASGVGKRLDQYVIHRIPRLSRAYASTLIAEGRVHVNGAASKSGYKVKYGDAVTIDYDESQLDDIPDIMLPVLYEDDDCVVINKPVGVLTHSRGGLSTEPTVATWLRSRVHASLSGERGGIVHRLDRATSGVLICAKNVRALGWLQKQFADRTTEKTYYAIVKGSLPHEHAVIDMPIVRNPKYPQTFRAHTSGKSAVTEYWVRHYTNSYALVELRPKTGRTHQLRVHLRELGHPIVGDSLYGGEPAERLYLHAARLRIVLPNGTSATFQAPVPDTFMHKVEQ